MRSRCGCLQLGVTLVAAVVACTAGCKQYEVDVTLREDGSGFRSIEMTPDMEALSKSEIGFDEFRSLFGLTDARGWSVVEQPVKVDGDTRTRTVLRHRVEVHETGDWRRSSDDIRIVGSLEEGSSPPTYLSNSIVVEIEQSDGARVYTYRETFSWEGLLDWLVAFEADAFSRAVATRYPFLGAQEIAQLRGVVKGIVITSLYLGEEAGNVIDEILDDVVTTHLTQVVHRHDPTMQGVDEFVHQTATETEQALEAAIDEELPGAALAFWTSIVINVSMPGRVITHNGDEQEGSLVRWELGGWDALAGPVELQVRSQVPVD